jgi:hypothetical protein
VSTASKQGPKPKNAAPLITPEEEAQILELRAARLRAKPTSVADEAPFWVAEFPVGDEQYAIPLGLLRACIPLKMVTPVPLSPPHVIGVVRFQGEILSAFSMSALLEGKGWRTDPSVLLVVDQGRGSRSGRWSARIWTSAATSRP